MIPHVTDPLYFELAGMNDYSSNIVICFFILSGFFLYQSFQANPDRCIFEYIVSRVVRLWPLMMIAFLLEALLSGQINWNRTLINAFFLQCSGISLEFRGMMWYVSAFFFASIFLYSLLRSFSPRKSLLIIAVITYFSCVFMVNYFDGRIGGRETVFNIINIGTLRGIAFIGTGILLGECHIRISEMTGVMPPAPSTQKFLFLMKLVTEILCLRFLYRYFLQSRSPGNHIVLVLVFSILLLCMFSRNDPIGLFLNRKILGFGGKYAYAIYVMQGTGFLILKKTLWQSKAFVENVPLALLISTMIILAIGIAGYYAVEMPCARLYQNWFRKYQNALRDKMNQ